MFLFLLSENNMIKQDNYKPTKRVEGVKGKMRTVLVGESMLA